MNALPTELISLLGSSIFGSAMKLWSFSITARHRERMIALNKKIASVGNCDALLKNARPNLQLTRRIIALTAVFFIIAFPKLLVLINPDISVSIGYSQLSDGFLFFSSAVEKIKWVQMKGVVITPLDTHLLSAIIGLYFGGALVER